MYNIICQTDLKLSLSSENKHNCFYLIYEYNHDCILRKSSAIDDLVFAIRIFLLKTTLNFSNQISKFKKYYT